ncbi:MAG TPA: cupredoxin domain-containing protein [Allosphingosinicella sp.]|nr:cupredoxin domain-containing protein [Allosphingosinicella sp.]
MRTAFFALLLFAPAALSAQEASAPRVVEVRLSNFDFSPSAITLPAGRPVVLHLVNSGGGGHNFSAPQFFAAATGVSGPVRRGAVEVPGRQSVDVRLTPARGTYRLKCTHTLHSAFGMNGEIRVE